VAATDAVSAARKLVLGDRLAEARLFYQHTRIARRGSGLTAAVRWAARGLRSLEGLEHPEASVWRVRLLGVLAFTRYYQNRPDEAERLCREAISEAEAVGELRGLAQALFHLDLAVFELGRPDEAIHSPRALEIFTRLGDFEQQGIVLNNMAMFAYHRWAWDEALELYSLAVERFRRAGNPAELALAECNIGELLSDRGRYDEASRYLARAHRVWRSTGDRAASAFAATLRGRLEARAGRGAEGRVLLQKAAAELRSFGESGSAEFAESLLSEAEALAGDPGAALALAGRLHGSVTREVPLLHRASGIALARRGDVHGAERELQLALAIARERGALYDIAATLDALDTMGLLASGGARERDALLARLQIERLPGWEPDARAKRLVAVA
jgi:tetratricopeptide (TPR) repeat protein